MIKKEIPFRDSAGRYMTGTVPLNKIVLPETKLKELYKEMGATAISKKLGVSKPTVLRNLHEYNFSIRKSGAPSELPKYWKEALRKPKSVPAWNKGLTKKNNKSIKMISDKLKGAKNRKWKPELHTEEKIECICGCGELISKYDIKGRKRYYAKNHCKGGWFKKNQTTGNKNVNWKGGISSKHSKIRHSVAYKDWRLEVYKKDRFSCQLCGNKKNIVAHHIRSFIEYPEERYDIDNGATLCRSCHLKLHQGGINYA